MQASVLSNLILSNLGLSKITISSQAWIQNCSVKDNILFHLAVDENRYQSSIDACALRQDLDILPAGSHHLRNFNLCIFSRAL